MNTTNATVLVADISHQIKRANEMGATHLQLPTLDVVWLIEMAKRDIARSEHPDDDNLQMLHEMVAQLCVKLGANPDEVPCDVWHLAERIEKLQTSSRSLTEQIADLEQWKEQQKPVALGWADALSGIAEDLDLPIGASLADDVRPAVAQRLGIVKPNL